MMRKRLISLILITIAVLAIGLILTQRQQPQSEGKSEAGPLITGLNDAINDVSTLKISGAKDQLIAELSKQDGAWVVVNRHGYPADFAKIREYLIKLADAGIREVKTSKAENYGLLGVEDLSNDGAKGLGVELGGGKLTAKLIVGISAGTGTPGTFVRKQGEAQTLLVSGDLVPERESSNWMAKEILDLPSSQVLSVAVTAPDKSVLKLDKVDPNAFNYTVYGIPKGRQLSSDSAGNLIAGSLANLSLEDVTPAADAPVDPASSWTATYVCYDGLTVDATLWGTTEKTQARFAARVDETQLVAWVAKEQAKADAERATAEAAAKAAADAAKAAPAADAASKGATPDPAAAPTVPAPFDAAKASADKRAELDKRIADINARGARWTYTIPGWKAGNIKKTLNDLLQPKS